MSSSGSSGSNSSFPGDALNVAWVDISEPSLLDDKTIHAMFDYCAKRALERSAEHGETGLEPFEESLLARFAFTYKERRPPPDDLERLCMLFRRERSPRLQQRLF